MNKSVPFETILDFLVGDKELEESLEAVLNFLQQAEIIIRRLYWSQKFKNDFEEDKKYLGFLGFGNNE